MSGTLKSAVILLAVVGAILTLWFTVEWAVNYRPPSYARSVFSEARGSQHWEVRWLSRSGKYSGETKERVRTFDSKQDAEEFADSIKAAFALLQHTGEGTKVEIVEP